MTIKRIAGLLMLLGMATGAQADVVLHSNEIALGLIRRHSTPPPIAARTLAMVHVAIFDAVNSIERRHQPFRVSAPDSPSTSTEAAALQAAFRVLIDAYPADRQRLERELAENLALLPASSDRSAGVRLGNLVAERIIAWRSGDGSETKGQYTSKNEPGRWRPTPPDYQAALLPQWASVTPFGIDSPSQFRPADPPDLKSKHYARDFDEVRLLGAVDSPVRTDDETEIAHFWADGAGTVTPPGHWNQIAQIVARQQRLNLMEQARLFALLSIALADAAIVCWDMKYHCDFWRPITAIREADRDNNDTTEPERNWRPLLETPPFPTCTSGHSTFSGAAAEMLAQFFGRDDIAFTTTSDTTARPRSFASFSEAAEEAGRSRIYGGIHFEFDNENGLSSGRALSRYLFRRHLQPTDAALAQASPQRRQTLRPNAAHDARPVLSQELDDSGWRPAGNRLREQQTFRAVPPGGNTPGQSTRGGKSTGASVPIFDSTPTDNSAGATTVLSPVRTMIPLPSGTGSMPAPHCTEAPTAEYRLPTAIPAVGDVGEAISYPPAY